MKTVLSEAISITILKSRYIFEMFITHVFYLYNKIEFKWNYKFCMHLARVEEREDRDIHFERIICGSFLRNWVKKFEGEWVIWLGLQLSR